MLITFAAAHRDDSKLGDDGKFAVKASEIVAVSDYLDGSKTAIFVKDIDEANMFVTSESVDEVIAKVNRELQPIYTVRQVVNLPANSPTDPCDCPPGTVCGNVMCPRRYVVSY